ncbi:hypothetical protein KA005_06540 [bacterium]|nr:hypothetical protein [bacterium]
MTFLDKYNREYATNLSQRTQTFRTMFGYLLAQNKNSYYIVETGTVRNTDTEIRKRMRDGYSTVLFSEFVKIHKGNVLSIDISKENCDISKDLCNNPKQVDIITADSVEYLWKYTPPYPIDLLYLDSFDLDTNDPHPSAFHHMKEFLAIERHLQNGALIVIDDHVDDKIGKGTYIQQFFKDVGLTPFFKDYQIGWIYRR